IHTPDDDSFQVLGIGHSRAAGPAPGPAVEPFGSRGEARATEGIHNGRESVSPDRHFPGDGGGAAFGKDLRRRSDCLVVGAGSAAARSRWDRRSQTRTVKSPEPEARRVPSGLGATAWT